MKSIEELNIKLTDFIRYKFLNSLFLGLSIGSVFAIYTPLQQSVYSIGGIVLALAMLFLARYYSKILNAFYFFYISLSVEVIVLLMLIYFLIFSYSYQTAILVYLGYQLTFVFGSYLVRAETLVIKEAKDLTKVDVAKQLGYLIGMALSFIAYQCMEHFGQVYDNQKQVYFMHIPLVLVECFVLLFLWRSFKN